ncbi:MAG: hypothetical protein GF398_21320 [Chitinivibrionales bacterium]|nr:hypothetical protein [Chitinivibrionales bacterium]
MKVLIITEEDVFYVYEFFKTFFPLARDADYTLSGITILEPFNKKSKLDLARQMYGFFGPLHFFTRGFLYVFRTLTGQSVRGLARKQGLTQIPTEKVNSKTYVEQVRQHNIDLIVSIAAPQIFKKNLIQAVPKGCINSHSALLPENKGMMPVFWSMHKKAEFTGVTIHYINETIDEGDIIVQQRVPIDSSSLHAMIIKTKILSAHLVHQTIESIGKGDIHTEPMQKGGSYQTFPTPREVIEFRRRGNRII